MFTLKQGLNKMERQIFFFDIAHTEFGG